MAEDGGDEEEPEGRLERIVFPFVRNSLMVPVTFAIAAHLALAIATTLVYLIRERMYVLVVLVLAFVWGSVKLVRVEVRDAGKPGPLLAWILFTWAGGVALTWALFDWL